MRSCQLRSKNSYKRDLFGRHHLEILHGSPREAVQSSSTCVVQNPRILPTVQYGNLFGDMSLKHPPTKLVCRHRDEDPKSWVLPFPQLVLTIQRRLLS